MYEGLDQHRIVCKDSLKGYNRLNAFLDRMEVRYRIIMLIYNRNKTNKLYLNTALRLKIQYVLNCNYWCHHLVIPGTSRYQEIHGVPWLHQRSAQQQNGSLQGINADCRKLQQAVIMFCSEWTDGLPVLVDITILS